MTKTPSTPSKADTPKERADIKMKISSKDTKSPKSTRSELTKSNYNIFILNVETSGVQSILREFIVQAKDRKRKVVVPIVIEEIEKEISLEKGQAKTVLKSTEDADKQNKADPHHATSEEIFLATKVKIAEHIEENDSLLAELSSIKKLDILHYWKEQEETIVKQSDGKKEARSARDSKSVVSTNSLKTKPKSKRSRRSTRRTEEGNSLNMSAADNENCALDSLPEITLHANLFSRFHPSNRISHVHEKFIEDHPEEGPILYIIIIGTVSQDFCLNLLRENYPLIAIMSLCSKSEINNKSFRSMSDVLALNEETKGTYLVNLDFDCTSKFVADAESDTIYSELCWLMYDVITLKRQHANYLAHVNEVDVSENDATVRKPISQHEIPEQLTEIDIVPLYLDNMLDTVANAFIGLDDKSKDPRSFSLDSENLPPTLFNYYGKKIAEYRNGILTNAWASEGLAKQCYPKYMELISAFSLLNSIWNGIDRKKNFQRHSSSPSATLSSRFGSKSTVTPGGGIYYVEVFSRDAMIQRFQELHAQYDFYSVDHMQGQNELNVCFYNSTNQYHEESEIFFIPTKLCFRDYCKYRGEDIEDWTKAQEIIYEAHKKKEAESQKQAKIIKFEEISDSDFVFDPSLKKQGRLSKYHVETVLRCPKSKSQDTSVDTLVNVHPVVRTEPEKQKIFTAYNIGDTRFQILSTKAKFKTPGGSVNIVEDKYITGKTLNRIDIDYFGDHVLYHHSYPSASSPLTMKVLCSNASSMNLILSFSKTNPQSGIKETKPHFSDPSSSQNRIELKYVLPTGLEIRTVHDHDTGELLGIEQLPKANSSPEVKRMYHTNGTVAIYYDNGSVDILAPSGAIYETMQLHKANKDATSWHGESSNTDVMKKNNLKHFFEISALQHLKCDIFNEKYKLITPDGHVFEAFGEALICEKRKMHLVEWSDFACGEYYSMLEGGIKTRLVGNKYDVYFQNGTLMTTTTNEETILENFPEDSINLRSVTGYDTSAENVTGSLVDMILDYVSEGHYTTYERTFLIQHENYATVQIDKDEVKISCPDEICITLKENAVEVNIKKQLNIECNPNECSIRGCKDQDLNNTVESKFVFDSCLEPFLRVKSGPDAVLTVSQDGSRHYASNSGHCLPKFLHLKEKRIIINRYLEGYEIHKGSDIQTVIERAESAKLLTLESHERVLILHPVQPLIECFKMPNADLTNFLKNFVHQEKVCWPLKLPAEAALNRLPNLMTMRLFLLCTKYFRHRYPSTAELPSTASLSLGGADCKNENSMMNLVKFLQHEAEIALDEYITKNSLKNNLTDVNITTASFKSTKFKSLLASIEYRRRRAATYREIIRRKLCPIFEEFKSANGSVANMDVEKYKQIFNRDVGRS